MKIGRGNLDIDCLSWIFCFEMGWIFFRKKKSASTVCSALRLKNLLNQDGQEKPMRLLKEAGSLPAAESSSDAKPSEMVKWQRVARVKKSLALFIWESCKTMLNLRRKKKKKVTSPLSTWRSYSAGLCFPFVSNKVVLLNGSWLSKVWESTFWCLLACLFQDKAEIKEREAQFQNHVLWLQPWNTFIVNAFNFNIQLAKAALFIVI